MRIIDSAVAQPDPIKPRKLVVIVLGILLGLICSMGLVTGSASLRRGINTSEQLEGLGVQVMATLPPFPVAVEKPTCVKNVFLAHVGDTRLSMSLSCQLIGLRMFLSRPCGARTSLHFTLQDAANRS